MNDADFDYIIVGAGSAGCVLANRLSANPNNRVLLLEAGGRDNWIWFHIPVGYLFAIGNPRSDWMFRTEPEPGLNGRSLAYPRGKVIGGSSSINGMIYMRGDAADFDQWRQLGLAGWGWNDVLPYFKVHEDFCGGADEVHGAGGEWRVDPPRVHWPLLDVVKRAAIEAGIKPTAGLVSRRGVVPLSHSLDTAGPMAWSAEDCAILLAAIAGHDPEDAASAGVDALWEQFAATTPRGVSR